jgi:hypothetical protein
MPVARRRERVCHSPNADFVLPCARPRRAPVAPIGDTRVRNLSMKPKLEVGLMSVPTIQMPDGRSGISRRTVLRAGAVGGKTLRTKRNSTIRWLVPALIGVTLCVALAGAAIAVRIVSATPASDGRAPTSFGALWVESSQQIAVPQTNNKGNFGMPVMGAPDKVMLEVTVRLANTDKAPVDLTPDRFSLRLGPGRAPVSVEGARFESVRLLPGAVFDARVQFPVVKGGEYQPALLFDDPGRSKPITLDLGRTQIQQPAGNEHQHH